METADWFRVGTTETHCDPAVAAARAAFTRGHALLSRPGIDLDLLGRLSAAAGAVEFASNEVEHLGHRWIEQPHRLGAGIELALARRSLLDWLEQVTGCGPLTHIEGRVVQTQAGGRDGLDWHSDTHDRAQLGLTLHLADCGYEGGAFEVRDTVSHAQTFEHSQARAGDVVVFDIDRHCQHRVAPIVSGTPRLVFTGWFMNGRL